MVNLNKQTYVVPNSKQPGRSAIYRNAIKTEITESFNPKVKTMYDIFECGYKLAKDRPCLGHRPIKADGTRGPYVWETYREVSHRITNFGSGLVDLLQNKVKLDLHPGTSNVPIGIWAINRPEWFITDMACAAYSLYIIALYDTLGPDSVEYVVNHSETEVIVCSGDHIADLLKQKEKLPNLKVVISMDSIEDEGKLSPGSVSKSALVKAWAAEKGIYLTDMKSLELVGQKNRIPHNLPQPDDLACIMYTSGTTGNPKGAMLTHRNFVAAISGSHFNTNGTVNDINISYLPLAHIFGRVCDATAIACGSRIGYFGGDMLLLVDDIQELKPTIMATVPRLLNRIYAKVAASTIQAPGAVGALSRRGIAVKLENLQNGKGYTHPVWDRLVFNKVKKVLGGNMRIMITGSAPIGKDIMQFLRVAFCCDIREGYGATETCAASTIHYGGENLAGHIGAPFPNNEVMLVDVPEMNYLSTDPLPRGEICIRGPNIFKGYFKDEEKTREAIDDEGWFHTGDIGLVNERGCIVIIDRKKNIFKLAQGEYIAPEKIENIYAKEGVIAQCFVYGDSFQSSLVGIIVPDPETLPAFIASRSPKLGAQKLSYQELCKNPEVNKIILDRLTQVGKKAGLNGFEQVKALYLETEPFSMENDLLTPTFKVKRPQAKKHFEAQINALYEALNSVPEKSKL